MGILLGDGGITEYQITITLHEFDDGGYIDYVNELGRKLFGLSMSMYSKSVSKAVDLVISRKKLVSFFEDMGLKKGDKIENKVSVPEWIKQSREYTKACLRGLFDTDGCFYVDKHRYGDMVYQNPAMVFTNYSLPIASFFTRSMIGFGYNPTQSWNRSKRGVNVYLRREEEIVEYYKEIGFSNTKHSRKFLEHFGNRS